MPGITVRWGITVYEDGKEILSLSFDGPPSMVPAWLSMMDTWIKALPLKEVKDDNP